MQAKATEWWCQELSRYRSEEQRRDLSLPPARLPTYISGLNEESEQNPPKGLNSVSLVHAPVLVVNRLGSLFSAFLLELFPSFLPRAIRGSLVPIPPYTALLGVSTAL